MPAFTRLSAWFPSFRLCRTRRTTSGCLLKTPKNTTHCTNSRDWWKNPVELILGLFGLVNAGVVISNTGPATWLVLGGLLIGKPLGITLFTCLGEKMFGLRLPDSITYRHIVTLGVVAGIGFTVALFVSTAAFGEPGPNQDSAKMEALASFASAIIAVPIGRLLKVKSSVTR